MVRESLRIRRAAAPHQRFQIALTLNMLTRLLVLSGKNEAADLVAIEAMAMWRQVLPTRGKSIAKLAVSFGVLHLRRGQVDAAERLFTEALQIYRACPERPMLYIKSAIGGMVQIHNTRDDHSQAFVPVRMAFVQLAREVCGEGEPYLGEVLVDHAAYLRDRDRSAEAIRMGIEGLNILLDTEPENAMVARALRALRDVAWKAARDPARSPEEYGVARDGAEFCLEQNPEDPGVTDTLGALQYRLGRLEEALATLIRSDARPPEASGGEPAAAGFLAMAHFRLGHAEEARAALARLREVMLRPEVAIVEENRALFAEAQALIEGGEQTNCE